MKVDALIAKVKVLPSYCGDAGMQNDRSGRRGMIFYSLLSGKRKSYMYWGWMRERTTGVTFYL